MPEAVAILESALARPHHLLAYGTPDIAALAACYERGRVLARRDEPEGIRVEVEMPRRLMASFEGYRLEA